MSLLLKYFVLRPSEKDPHGIASMRAMLAYAESIQRHDPELAIDLINWIHEIRGEEKITKESLLEGSSS